MTFYEDLKLRREEEKREGGTNGLVYIYRGLLTCGSS
jgi:hypothetical protein